jgi:ring-1,2-phenylacetyl-CoA epoxidase subunit PaaE
MLTFHSLKVVEIHPEAEDAVGIAFDVPPELRAAYRGLPGQHVVIKTDINDVENRRTYSLVNPPGDWPLRIVARVHSTGHMSRYLAEQLNAGDFLDVLPPNGSFTPRRLDTGGTYVAFASGCGITPVLAVTRALLEANGTNRVILFYGNASTGRAMCLEELLGLKDRFLGRLSLHFVMSREPQESELYNGRIDAARVKAFARSFFVPAEVTEYFVCGPGNMIDEVSGVLRTLGVEADRIHGEHFTVGTTAGAVAQVGVASAGPAVMAGAASMGGGAAGVAGAAGAGVAGATTSAAAAASAASPASGGPVRSDPPAQSAKPTLAADESEVTILMDGRRRTFTMRMNDEVVLDAAMRCGLELPFSCRAGVCSTCRTKVVKGEVEMAQNYALEEWEVEQGYVLACQSRVKTPVLELDYDEK